MKEKNGYPRPILVTGAHRTGTTWVGKMLTAGGETAYISEPLNILHRPGVMITPTCFWYTYICEENEADYLPGLHETLNLNYHPFSELKSLRSRKDLLRMGRDWNAFLLGKLLRRRPLVKDPFAVFSAPWFARRLGCQVVITIRHPAAFVSSLKRLNWSFDFSDLLSQPLLMRDWLEPFRAEMETRLAAPADVIGQGSLLWRMIYHVVRDYQQRFPEFQVVRHEDLSLEPVENYRRLYTALGLNFSSKAEHTILNSSSSDNPHELSQKAVHATQLDSRANLHNWKKRLSPDEIERIRALTEDAAEYYYPGWE